MHNNKYGREHPKVRDFGPNPIIFNIENVTNMNRNFRTTLWTGEHLQLTLMSIPVGESIGVEMHSDVDQFIRVESGMARVYMGDSKNSLREQARVNSQYAIIIPAGTWHNIVNIGNIPLKLYSIYAPPQHPFGTVHKTKADAEHSGD